MIKLSCDSLTGQFFVYRLRVEAEQTRPAQKKRQRPFRRLPPSPGKTKAGPQKARRRRRKRAPPPGGELCPGVPFPGGGAAPPRPFCRPGPAFRGAPPAARVLRRQDTAPRQSRGLFPCRPPGRRVRFLRNFFVKTGRRALTARRSDTKKGMQGSELTGPKGRFTIRKEPGPQPAAGLTLSPWRHSDV